MIRFQTPVESSRLFRVFRLCAEEEEESETDQLFNG